MAKLITRFDLVKLNQTVCQWLIANNPILLDKLLPSTKVPWTEDGCKKEALKYKSRQEWGNNASGSYTAALNGKWIDQCCKHMVSNRVQKGYWTKEMCMKDANNYVSRTEWREKSLSAATAAHRRGWFQECCAHMGKRSNAAPTLEECISKAKICSSKKEWRRQCYSMYRHAKRKKWLTKISKVWTNG